MKSKGKIGLATKATIAIAEALDPVGVPLEVLGHFTRRPPMSNLSDEQQEREVKAMYGRRDLLIMTQFKDFDDNLSRCKSALGSIDSLYGGANADGDAILFAAKRLLERREERKMLFVLSDGQPAYRSDTRCKHQYTRDAVDWCTFRGIDVMGLGMLDQSVSQYYPKYVVINDMNDFARTYIEELVKMMQKRALPDQSLLIRSTAKRGRNI
jgi:cobalamin biosynthesis protein CobT